MKLIMLILLVTFPTQAKTIRVAVVDSGLSSLNNAPLCADSIITKDYSKISHGTKVVNLITENAKNADYCITSFAVFNPEFSVLTYIKILNEVKNGNFDIINFSMGGHEYYPAEVKLIKSILDQGTTIIAASGNDKNDLDKDCNYYPACDDPRIIIVGSTDKPSGYGSVVKLRNKDWTSYATAVETGRFIKFIKDHDK